MGSKNTIEFSVAQIIVVLIFLILGVLAAYDIIRNGYEFVL